MGTEYPATKTPVTSLEMYRALSGAWNVLWSEIPSRPTLCVLLAQWSLETGDGEAMMNYNVGNFKQVNPDAGDYTYFPTFEYVGGHKVRLTPKDPGCRFRAYTSLQAGCQDYLAMMHGRFAHAWPAVLTGDPAAFARLLSEAHYYTAPESEYEAGLVARFWRFMGLPLQSEPAPPIDLSGDDEEDTNPSMPTLVEIDPNDRPLNS